MTAKAKMTPLELLGKSLFFKDLGTQSMQKISALCLARRLPRKAVLFSEGQQGDEFFLLASGHVQLSKLSPDGGETVIKVVNPGEIFAEVILFELDRYPVTAVAVRESLVYAVRRRPFYDLLKDADLLRDFLGMLMRKQRYLTEQIHLFTKESAERRLLHFLKKQFGGQRAFEMTLSKKDVAAAIGVAPETFSRLWARLKEQGLIQARGRQIKISDRAFGGTL